jgi:hypothetical protein
MIRVRALNVLQFSEVDRCPGCADDCEWYRVHRRLWEKLVGIRSAWICGTCGRRMRRWTALGLTAH